MKVYVVRHGQSASNKSNVRNGQTDVPLTEQGYEDARKAGAKIKCVQFDRIFSSDLIRAIETAKTAIPGCEPIQYKEIREIDVGQLAGHTSDECRGIFENYDVNNEQHNYVPYGGENAQMIFERVSQFMGVLEKLTGCENVAVFTHHGAIYYMLKYVIGCPVDRTKFTIDNGSVTILDYKNSKWKIDKLNI